ncbi:MAG: response regulator [Proteobacteria bacterium]|nr:response regulator [Pseudomonadota bacterium]
MAEVLLIDDDPRFRAMVRMMLEGGGHAVRAAADGVEGIDRFSQRRPDIVIADMIMPRCDGIETIGVLRWLDSSVPIIAVSGGSVDVLGMARASGAVATLAKPFDASTLLTAVTAAIGGSRLPN